MPGVLNLCYRNADMIHYIFNPEKEGEKTKVFVLTAVAKKLLASGNNFFPHSWKFEHWGYDDDDGDKYYNIRTTIDPETEVISDEISFDIPETISFPEYEYYTLEDVLIWFVEKHRERVIGPIAATLPDSVRIAIQQATDPNFIMTHQQDCEPPISESDCESQTSSLTDYDPQL